MRTGIYVYADSIISIETSEDNLQLEPMTAGSPVALARSNRIAIGPGVFRVISMQTVEVTPDAGDDVEIIALGDKDKWPDPPPALTAMFSGVTTDSLGAFFPMSKAIAI